MKIERTLSPKAEDINFLTQKLNEETPEFGLCHPFAFFIRNDKDEIIAGLNGSVVYGCIYTDQLWVHTDYRKKGVGRELMEKVHDYGNSLDCKFAEVHTMSFQNARKFYEKLGYSADFVREGSTEDSSCIFLKKIL